MMTGQFERHVMADGAEIPVYHAVAQGVRRGGIVLLQEIFGVNSHIRSLCDRFAALGFEVLAPALFDREAPGFEVGYDADGIAAGRRLARELHPIALSLSDTQSCIDALAPDGPVFVVGYCYGGSLAWFAATRLHGVAAAASYYGALVPDAAGEVPRCPVVLHFGRHDPGIPLAGVERVIAASHPGTQVYLYDAGHGFNCDQRADYDPPAAARALDRTLALFAAAGGGDG